VKIRKIAFLKKSHFVDKTDDFRILWRDYLYYQPNVLFSFLMQNEKSFSKKKNANKYEQIQINTKIIKKFFNYNFLLPD